MKKSILMIAAAASLLTVVSCGNNTTEEVPALTQAQQDSILNARLEEEKIRITDSIQAEQVRIADSIRVADSLLTAGKNLNKPATTQTTKKTTTKTTTNKNNNAGTVSPKTGQDAKFDQRGSGEAKVSEQKAKEQDDKFNNRR